MERTAEAPGAVTAWPLTTTSGRNRAPCHSPVALSRAFEILFPPDSQLPAVTTSTPVTGSGSSAPKASVTTRVSVSRRLATRRLITSWIPPGAGGKSGVRTRARTAASARHRLDGSNEALAEHRAVPPHRVGANPVRLVGLGIEVLHRTGDRLRALVLEQLAGRPGLHGVARPAARVGQHRPAACHDLEGQQTEVIAAWKHQRGAALNEANQLGVGSRARELHSVGGDAAQLPERGAVPRDHQPMGQAPEGLDRFGGALV